MRSLLHTAVILLTLLFALPAWALLDELRTKYPFKIQLAGDKDLKEQLSDELEAQREGSARFDALDDWQSVRRFDRDVLKQLLEAEGYYRAEIDARVENDTAIYRVEPGEPYRVQDIVLDFPKHVPPPKIATLPIQPKQRLRAAAVLDTVSHLRDYVLRNHCLYQVDVRYQARVETGSRQARLVFSLADSPSVTFAEPEVRGLDSIKPEYMRRFVPFEAGDCFRRNAIEEARLLLLQSNLIASTEVEIAEPDDGQVKTVFQLMERRHRTWRAGLGYESITGPRFTLGWQHRNLFNRGRRLDIEATVSELGHGISTELTAPHFRRRGQTLTVFGDVTREFTDAYKASQGEFGANINRSLRRHWAGNVGTVLEFSRVEREGEEEDFALLSFPVSLEYNRTDDLLNPRYGWSVDLRTQPFVDLYQTSRRFLKTTVIGAVYLTESDWRWQPTLALQAATGTLSDAALGDVPLQHRYYVGGGGSVRGYSYQSVGELDADSNPIGGLSFSETSVELRLRLSESWGAVLFADGGYAYPGRRPEFGHNFLWGAGVGLRYFTSFAPFRLDIATPLTDRRSESGAPIDNDVEVYISIGQAF